MASTIIITGAGRGLGRAILDQCLKDGLKVIACDKDPQLLLELRNVPNVSAHEVDVTDIQQVKSFFHEIADQRPDGLINNAGIYYGRPLLDYSPEEIDNVINVNIKGVLYFTQYFAKPLMKEKRKGVIVNMSSASIHGGSDAVYSLTKAGLIGLTKSSAMNFSPYIRVNAITPGIVLTDMFKTIPEKTVSWYREKELIKEQLVPEDVANTVSFLLSDKSRNYTGAVFNLSNGYIL